ncbi:glycosyltransferase [Candidatus Pelagibacter sp.]|nr:glycosyltransferase [Candidatus Pelagibacter sp.]
MNKKIKILRIIPTLDPSYGGPVTGIIDSTKLLKKMGVEIDIVTHDSEFKSNLINSVKIFNLGPSYGKYNLNLKFYKWIKLNNYKYDAFIIHGIWNFSSLVARILLKYKYYVFLHGALDPYFKNEFFKCFKKKIYWYLFEKKNLSFSKGVLLTNEFEKKQLRNTYVNTDGIKKRNIGYGILEKKLDKKKIKKIFYNKFSQLRGKKFYLFLGRFHKKKGCFILIKSVENMLKKNRDIYVLMAGPISEHKKKIQKYCDDNNLYNKIIWSDEISDNLKWGAIYCSYCMVLPSHGENFGISLVESLSYSRPVITTTKVGIHSKISEYKAGFVSANNLQDFQKKLIKMHSLKKKEYLKLTKNAQRCFKKNYDLEISIKDLYKLLKN